MHAKLPTIFKLVTYQELQQAVVLCDVRLDGGHTHVEPVLPNTVADVASGPAHRRQKMADIR